MSFDSSSPLSSLQLTASAAVTSASASSSATTTTRLRHSSTPHSLPSTWSPRVHLSRPFCFEAEDAVDLLRPCTAGRGLASWEERVLRAREERHWRRARKIALVSASSADGAKVAPIGDQNSLNVTYAGKVDSDEYLACRQSANNERSFWSHVSSGPVPADTDYDALVPSTTGTSTSTATPRSTTTPSNLKSDCYETEPEQGQVRLQTTSICYEFCIRRQLLTGRRTTAAAGAARATLCCQHGVPSHANKFLYHGEDQAACHSSRSATSFSSCCHGGDGVCGYDGGDNNRAFDVETNGKSECDISQTEMVNLQNMSACRGSCSSLRRDSCCFARCRQNLRIYYNESEENLCKFEHQNNDTMHCVSLHDGVNLPEDRRKLLETHNRMSCCGSSCVLHHGRGRTSQPSPPNFSDRRSIMCEKEISKPSPCCTTSSDVDSTSSLSADLSSRQCLASPCRQVSQSSVSASAGTWTPDSRGGVEIHSDTDDKVSLRSSCKSPVNIRTRYSSNDLGQKSTKAVLRSTVDATMENHLQTSSVTAPPVSVTTPSVSMTAPPVNVTAPAATTKSARSRNQSADPRTMYQSDCRTAAYKRRRRSGLSFCGSSAGVVSGYLTSLILVCLVSTSSAAYLTTRDSIIPHVCKEDINIRHSTDFSSLKKYENCTVLEGSLQINSALKDYTKAWDQPPFSFPNLIEITDYLLLFRANQIGNLSLILPKLAVIRGHRLVHNSALAVYQMKNLNTLGLYSLTSIMKGGVRIEKNPALCYVNTINWKKIVMDDVVIKNDHIFIEENMDSRDCLETCHDNCNDNCWDSDHCQIKLDKCNGDEKSGGGGLAGNSGMCYRDGRGQPQLSCSSQCLGGCTWPNSPEHCLACRNVWYTSNNNSVCVDKCPEDFLSYKEWKCISASECMQLRNPVFKLEEEQFYKIHTLNQHTKQCVNSCPARFEAVKNKNTGRWECQPCEDCPRPCDGGVINSREEAEAFRHCTIVLGNIEIRVSESDISPVLEKTMKDIKIIEGTFKVSRSFALVSLFFFTSLEEIQNKDKEEFAITVMENDNLQKLFPRNVKVNNGHAFIHYNQKLCMNEIEDFLKIAGVKKRDVYDVSVVTNGNKAACSKDKLNLVIYNVLSRFVYYNMTDFRRNLAETKSEDLNALIGYEIFYREITEEQFEEKKVSRYEGLDACGSNIWSVIDKRPTQRNATQQRLDSIADWYTEPEQGMLYDLKPFTPYAVYANTLMVPHLATKATGAQSDLVYFRTGSEPPEEIQRLKWRAETESTLFISWKPPKLRHGIIDHYEVQVELIQLDTEKMLHEKNYCEFKSANKIDKIPPKKDKQIDKKPAPPRNDSSCPVCDCDSVTDKPNIPDRGEDHIDEQQFYNDLINKIFTMPSSPIMIGPEEEEKVETLVRRKRSISRGGGSGNELVENPESEDGAMSVVRRINKFPEITPWSNKTKPINGTDLFAVVHLIVKDTEVLIENLKHFSQYQVKVMACHQVEEVKLLGKTKKQKLCSPWTIAEAKTLPKATADDIVMENDEIDIYMANETTGKTFMRWIPPADPNQMIIHYTVRTTKALSDESTNFLRCIPLSALETLDNGWVQTTLKREGEIWVSLRAVSNYGPGKWTKWQWAMVNTNTSYTWIVVVIVLGLLCTLCLATLLYWRQKKKPKPRSGWDLVSHNPEYLDTGFVYQQDEWEVSRELITKGEELGSGSFGVCYKGTYNHPDKGPIPVAIKSVPDHATFGQRIEFLNEASVMKDINTEYVVRLIGVVSQGQPTLVLMELMENGDLRKYLRSLRPDKRDDSVEPPTLQRTLQMALEIADGMAYLSVRKYVHRDLAARNCLVSSNFVVKVGDFGMAQDVYEKEYYRTEGRRLLPVRWMAPESLRDGKFTSKSDVWSYGVVLWEMATLAEQPYQGWGNDEVVIYVKEGSIMPRPDNCPDRLYDLMRDCWQRNEEQRPSFLDICERLLPEANDHYRSSSFYLSSQGVEAMASQRAHREQAEVNTQSTTPLTNNGGAYGDNNGSVTTNGGGDARAAPGTSAAPGNSSSGGGGPTISFRSSPTHISFSLTGGLRQSASKTTANGLGVIQRLRNKSGSSSGNAA